MITLIIQKGLLGWSPNMCRPTECYLSWHTTTAGLSWVFYILQPRRTGMKCWLPHLHAVRFWVTSTKHNPTGLSRERRKKEGVCRRRWERNGHKDITEMGRRESSVLRGSVAASPNVQIHLYTYFISAHPGLSRPYKACLSNLLHAQSALLKSY